MRATTDALTVRDHTALVQAVLDRPLHVIKYLEFPRGGAPTPQQVLTAALKVRSFDAETKSRLRTVSELLPTVEAGQAQLPRTFVDTMEQLEREITGKSVEEKLSILARARVAHADDELAAPALEVAEQILIDGAGTIYSPESPVAELLEGPEFGALQDIAAVDVITGSIGAGAGALIGGLGAVPAGAVAAGSGSLGAAIATIAISVLT